MDLTRQRTIGRTAEVRGFGLFGGRDCTLRFQPAPENHGIAFVRTELPGTEPIPAVSEYVVSLTRRTAISNGSATVEMIEHVMAALAGLCIDNCLVEVDAPEPPVGDGSSLEFVQAILAAGIVEQAAVARTIRVNEPMVVGESELTGDIHATPGDRLIVQYDLNYSSHLIARQSVRIEVTPEVFASEIAQARTFVLDIEIDGLRRLGFGKRVTTQNLLVIGSDGVQDNEFRMADECARHKVLDFLGDLALCGARPVGEFHCRRSGHHHNQSLASLLRATGAPCQEPGETADEHFRVIKSRRPRGIRASRVA